MSETICDICRDKSRALKGIADTHCVHMMTNDSSKAIAEFDLRQWASKEKYFAINNKEHFSGLVQGRIQGFNKALDLVMEEASKQFYKIGDAGVPVLTSRQLQRIITKLRGER
jgi:hypothetical protein